MKPEHKLKLIIYLFMVLLGSIVLSFGLSRMIFQSEKTMPIAESTQTNNLTYNSIDKAQYKSNNIAKGIFLSLLIIPIAAIIIYKIKTSEKRKEMFNSFIFGFIFIVGIIAIFSIIILIPATPSGDSSPLLLKSIETEPEITQQNPAPIIFLLIPGFILLGLIIFFTIRLCYSINIKKSINQKITQESMDAREIINQGGDFNEAILNYYQKMCHIIGEEENIHRHDAMTTGEFEKILIQWGVPKNPIHQLTRLFEKARYGNRIAKNNEKQIALSSFDSIINYFETRKAKNDQ